MENTNIILNALKNMQNDIRTMQDKREDSLWKEINFPCNLIDALNKLKKRELDLIRKNLAFKNLSSLKKSELALILSKLIPINYKDVLYLLDRDTYDLIKAIVKNAGSINRTNMSVSNVETLMGYGIVFPGLINNQKKLFMPIELINHFKEVDSSELEKIVIRNTEWIQITQGMMYYYGVLDAWRVIKKVEQLTKCKVDIEDFINVISFASDYYRQINFTDYGYKDARVNDFRSLIQEHNKRPNLEYYPFAKKEFINAGKAGYINDTSEMKSFIVFLQKNYNLSENDKNEIVTQLTNIINKDLANTKLIEYLQSRIEIPSFEYLQILTSKLMDLYNNTRQWRLKGHTPNELFQEEKKYLKPLPSQPFMTNQSKTNITDKSTLKKIGRNDPCPCGSGKKYKKCCGK